MHISKINTIKPESVAFVAYVMSQEYNIPFAELDMFDGLDVPFLKGTIKQTMLFGEPNGAMLEASLIYLPVDEGMASSIMIRVFQKDELVKDSLTLLHFVMRPFAADIVEKAMLELPSMAKAVNVLEKECDCGCNKSILH